jgi:tyrosyl-tRNA synthetase
MLDNNQRRQAKVRSSPRQVGATATEQLAELRHGTVDVISEAELLKRLEKAIAEDRPLRVKAGFDPTRPDLHLGHTVLMNKMRRFQELGHQVVFLVGDFTAMIGDPTGKNETRPPLAPEQIRANAQTYVEQVFKILDPDRTEIDWNSRWFQAMSPADFIKLAGQATVARMLERDDFEKRYKSGQPIAIHEFLYPLVQGHDSVALKADVELGGTDQKFNLLVGRDLQKLAGQEPQCVMTVPILEGLDGVQKMSKSLDNYIGITESPREIFGKTMRISDPLMVRYYELLSGLTIAQFQDLKRRLEAGEIHPREAKVRLAQQLVTRFHGEAAGVQARAEFDRIFVEKGLPNDIPSRALSRTRFSGEVDWPQLLKELDLVASTSEARRLIESGGLEVAGQRISAIRTGLATGASAKEFVLKVGKKKFLRIFLED